MKRVFAISSSRSTDFDLGGIGGIEHVHAWKSGRAAEGFLHHLDAETGAAHAEQHGIGETARADVIRDAQQVFRMSDLVVGDAEPAEPGAFIEAGPHGRVTGPHTAHFAGSLPFVEGFFDLLVGIGRKRVSLAGEFRLRHRSAAHCRAALSSLSNASAKSFKPSTNSLSVTASIEMFTSLEAGHDGVRAASIPPPRGCCASGRGRGRHRRWQAAWCSPSWDQ